MSDADLGNTKTISFSAYIRKPFEVQAIEVTRENINDIADQLELGEIYYGDNGVPYIEVDAERVPNMNSVYPGYWVTKVGKNNLRIYTRKTFFQQFVQSDEDIDEWMDYLNGKHTSRMPLPPDD